MIALAFTPEAAESVLECSNPHKSAGSDGVHPSLVDPGECASEAHDGALQSRYGKQHSHGLKDGGIGSFSQTRAGRQAG